MLLLSLFLLLFLLLLCNFVVATKKYTLEMPRAVLHQVSLTFTVRCKVSLTCTVRHTQVRCTPHYRNLVAKSGTTSGQLDMSAWHLQSDIPRSDVPCNRCIWWPRAVLCQVSLTFTVRHTQVRCNPLPVEASSGQEWYYVRSPWHLVILWAMLSLSQMCYSVYISSWIEQDIYVERSFLCLLLFLLLLWLLYHVVAAITRKLHIKKKKKNKKINLHTFSVQLSIMQSYF